MLDRRDFLQVGATTAGAALTATATAQDVPNPAGNPGPFSNPTKTFDPKDAETIPGWAFTQPFHHIPTIRPCKVATFGQLDKDGFLIHPADPVPLGEVFHGIAAEWWTTPPIWAKFFGCDPTKTGLAAWKNKQHCFGTFAHHKTGRPLRNWGEFPIKCYKVPIREAHVKLRPDAAADARVYGYGGRLPGPLFRHRIGQPAVVRFENQLETEVSIHLHGGHSPSHSDGFPSFYVLQNKARDYFYPHILPLRLRAKKEPSLGKVTLRNGHPLDRYDAKLGPAGNPDYVPDMAEAQSTMWYHDHGMDATGYNVSKGLASMALCYSEPELWLIANNVLPGLGERSCFDPDQDGLSTDKTLEDPHNPGYYRRSKEPFHNPYDIPMVLQDKIVDRDTGQIAFDSQGHNGYLGTTMFVNGVAWPTLTVENRKYRFRVLDGSNARIFRLRILSEADYFKARDEGMTSEEYEKCSREFLQIGKDTWLWSEPLPQKSVVLAMAKRVDFVFDFTERGHHPLYKQVGDKMEALPAPGKPGGRVFYLVNTMPQNDGRGPKVKLEVPEDPRMQALPFETETFKLTELNKPIPLMRFCVEGDPIPIEKEAEVRVHMPLIQPRPPIRDEEVGVIREFVFHRGKGFWMVNKRFYDPTISNASPVLGSAEEWVLRNGGGGWWHPIHIHLEGHQLIAYLKDFAADDIKDGENQTTLTPLDKMTDVTHNIARTELIANHDTQILGPNTAVRIRMRFRTWPGPFVFHCHNLEHEDMRMMFNFEPVPDENWVPPRKYDPRHHDPDAAPTARTHGNDLTKDGFDKEHKPDGRVGELPWELYPVPITPVERGGEFLIPPRKLN